jgi:carbonic anhydrase
MKFIVILSAALISVTLQSGSAPVDYSQSGLNWKEPSTCLQGKKQSPIDIPKYSKYQDGGKKERAIKNDEMDFNIEYLEQ